MYHFPPHFIFTYRTLHCLWIAENDATVYGLPAELRSHKISPEVLRKQLTADTTYSAIVATSSFVLLIQTTFSNNSHISSTTTTTNNNNNNIESCFQFMKIVVP